MGNRKSRELRLQQERDASWERLRSEPWHPDSTFRAFGSGIPRLQIIRLPSFSAPSFWEVCQLGTEWLLYRAEVVNEDRDSLAVRGYDRIEFSTAKLKGYFDRLVTLSMPVTPHLNNMGGADGTVTQLALFGDLCSQVRFQWWSDYPPGWAPLVRLADDMLEAFGRKAEAEPE